MILHQDPEKRPKKDSKAIVITVDYISPGIKLFRGSFLLECVDGFFQHHYEDGTRSHLRFSDEWLDKLKYHIKK